MSAGHQDWEAVIGLEVHSHNLLCFIKEWLMQLQLTL